MIHYHWIFSLDIEPAGLKLTCLRLVIFWQLAQHLCWYPVIPDQWITLHNRGGKCTDAVLSTLMSTDYKVSFWFLRYQSSRNHCMKKWILQDTFTIRHPTKWGFVFIKPHEVGCGMAKVSYKIHFFMQWLRLLWIRRDDRKPCEARCLP